MHEREEKTATRRGWLRRTGGLVGVGGLVATAGCLGRLQAPADDGDPESASGGGVSDQEPAGSDDTSNPGAIPYDVDVTHDRTAWERYDADWAAPTDPPASNLEATTLAENLEIPWDLSFAPTGDLFITERTGSLLRFRAGEVASVAAPDGVIDAGSIDPGSDESVWTLEGGEGGLLGTAVHPTYPDPPLVYVYYTTEIDGTLENRVVAADVENDGSTWPVVTGIAADTYHNGGRIEFGPANYLWVAAGDGDPGIEEPERIADPGTLSGVILRVRPDGAAPAENPTIDGGDPRVYTYGHRNPQGLAWLPDGTPVIAEHGPGGGDEVNVLRPGADYGWPRARNTGDYDRYTETDDQPPVAEQSDWAPAGTVFYTGDAVPTLRNRLLVGGLLSQQVIAATIHDDASPSSEHARLHDAEWTDDGYTAATDPLFTNELGRIRHVEQGPDGGLYAITSNRDGRAGDGFPTNQDDRLLRIEPAG